jgi:hypothetical protein
MYLLSVVHQVLYVVHDRISSTLVGCAYILGSQFASVIYHIKPIVNIMNEEVC